ncbi:MAG: hypothetical protein HY928_18455 [Elusimicrobia bacterium]|nr:hypothetical protein [Elusimicrobiota bacterium]
MLPILLAFCASAAAQVPALPPGGPLPGQTLVFSGFLSTWERPAGGIPSPLVADEPVQLTLTPPSRPGEAASARALRTLGDVSAVVELYAVCPHGPAAPEGLCPGLFFSFQLELTGRVAATCASSLNLADAYPFPVLVCAGPSGPGLTTGMTAHRRPIRTP